MAGPFTNEIAVSVLALLVAGWAAVCDWQSRRIPNWLTIPGLFLGLSVSTLAGGWPGAKASLEGTGLALAFLLPFVLAGGLGAGDWKLMAALGAFLGPSKTLVILLGTVLIAGLMAAVEMIRQRRVKQTLTNLAVLVHALGTFQVGSAGWLTLDNPGLMSLPFGVAAALAMTLFVCAQSALRIL